MTKLSLVDYLYALKFGWSVFSGNHGRKEKNKLLSIVVKV